VNRAPHFGWRLVWVCQHLPEQGIKKNIRSGPSCSNPHTASSCSCPRISSDFRKSHLDRSAQSLAAWVVRLRRGRHQGEEQWPLEDLSNVIFQLETADRSRQAQNTSDLSRNACCCGVVSELSTHPSRHLRPSVVWFSEIRIRLTVWQYTARGSLVRRDRWAHPGWGGTPHTRTWASSPHHPNHLVEFLTKSAR
jgi:hypothetical protein